MINERQQKQLSDLWYNHKQETVALKGSFGFSDVHAVCAAGIRKLLRKLPVDFTAGVVFDPLSQPDECFEVYVAEDLDGNTLYAGEGKRGRHKHLHSGRSSCCEANNWVFTHRPFNVIVYAVSSKELARSYEADLIKTFNPPWNIKGTKRNI